MKPKHMFQEILVFTDTHFAIRELCGGDFGNLEERVLSVHDKIEKAYWDGRLAELLPEVSRGHEIRKENFVWQIVTAYKFLCVNTGLCHQPVKHRLCINPYYFISSVNLN